MSPGPEPKRVEYVNTLLKQVEEVLFHDWDPIGINGNLGVRDEYDSYAPAVCRLLSNGIGEDELTGALSRLATDGMGLPAGQEDLHRSAAKKLIRLV